MANLNIFQAGTAGINFAAYCAMVNAEVDLMVTQREQLYKGLTDSEGNEVGLNYLCALQSKTSAEAVKESGLEQAAGTSAQAWGQIAGGIAGIGTLAATTGRAMQLESQGSGKQTLAIDLKEKSKSVDASTITDTSKGTTSAVDLKKQAKTAKNDAQSLASSAGNWRQAGHTVSSSLQSLSSGIGAMMEADHKAKAALEDEKRVLADGVREQINNTLQQLTAAIQSAEQREQMAMQTQAAIISATSRA